MPWYYNQPLIAGLLFLSGIVLWIVLHRLGWDKVSFDPRWTYRDWLDFLNPFRWIQK
jgi:hypothetical protein